MISLSLPLSTVTQDDKGVPELATNNPEPDIAAEGVQISQDEPKTEAESRQLFALLSCHTADFFGFFLVKEIFGTDLADCSDSFAF